MTTVNRAGTAGKSAAMNLADTQALFQKALLEGDDTILTSVCDNSRTTRDRLFGVYRHAYSARLADILFQDYEYLAAYTGADIFDAMAQAYIAANPSHSQNARWFGSRFPAFLQTQPSHAAHPEYADLANLEKALSDAFDAGDAEPLTITFLAQQIPPDDWGRLVFTPHPSVTLTGVETDAFALWKAMKAGEPAPAMGERAQHHLVAWRHQGTPMVRAMGGEEAMMWIEAARGSRFEVLCELLATYDDADQAAARAAGYLQGWLSTGMLASAELAP
jgi:hypothetical protein